MPSSRLTKEELAAHIQKESQRFETFFEWLNAHMPESFFEEVDGEGIDLIVHGLMSFPFNDFFTQIHLKQHAFILCLDSPDADLLVLKGYSSYGVTSYCTFLSNDPPPFTGITTLLRITLLHFTRFKPAQSKQMLSSEQEVELFHRLEKAGSKVTQEELHHLLSQLSPTFTRSLSTERLRVAIEMFFRAKTSDECQYDCRINEDWKDKKEAPSVQIVLAWRSAPKGNFLYRLAALIQRHNLVLKRISAEYIDPYSQQNILLMSLGLHGMSGKAAWEEANETDFFMELSYLKFASEDEMIDSIFLEKGILSGHQCQLLYAIAHFVHQSLVHADINMYSFENVKEALCRHPQLVLELMGAFEEKCHPSKIDVQKFNATRESFLRHVDQIDTGHELNDQRRKNILKQAMFFVAHILKTNVFVMKKIALCFRLAPQYLDFLPYNRTDKFPELPYGIFFIKGLHFIGFHIRFQDLSRGGLRTIAPEKKEQMLVERNNVFFECYQLAYTQNKKNKDIPEGGAKGVLFLESRDSLQLEESIYHKEMDLAELPRDVIQERLRTFHNEQKLESMYAAQRAYIESLMMLINCEDDGRLRAKSVLDLWRNPEYIYLGPDENMHNSMIEWIAEYSKNVHYKAKGAFISSRPHAGINHKEFGVTSLGVNVYMEEVLKFLGRDPFREPFTIKMTGGPDGDVAGNQMYNLYRFYPHTAKLLATIDVSGTIFDPKGLDLTILAQLFKESKPIRFYPPEKLNEGGFLLDLFAKREQTAYVQQTLCWRKREGKIQEDWLSGNEMNHLLRHNVHQTKADIFIPAGGRPRTLNETNVSDFLDEARKPTAQAIVEGANLYLTPLARNALETLGVLIVRDSSANKGGVICSSFEVLSSLVLSEEKFIEEKKQLVAEILESIQKKARWEALLLLETHRATGTFLTTLSNNISAKIHLYKEQLLIHLKDVKLSHDLNDPYIRCLLNYCPPLLRTLYAKQILSEVPDLHKKAIIACHIASRLVYSRGLSWSPSLLDVLPLILKDQNIIEY